MRPLLNPRLFLSAALAFLVLSGSGKAAPPAAMEAVVEEYQADLRSIYGFYDLLWSGARFNRLERLQHDWQGRLRELDFDALDQHGRVDYLLLRTKLDAELDDQALERKRLSELAELIPSRRNPGVRGSPLAARASRLRESGLPAVAGTRPGQEASRADRPGEKGTGGREEECRDEIGGQAWQRIQDETAGI